MTIKCVLLFSRQGKVRLSKWYQACSQQQQNRLVRDITNTVLSRQRKLCNFVEWNDGKIIYQRYASLFFAVWCESGDNELIMLEVIHRFVELLDQYFKNVCELDLIFKFQQAYHILDELVLAGELQETSKRAVLRACNNQDVLMDANSPGSQALMGNMKRIGLFDA